MITQQKNYYDIIIVGGGISGLYSAYKILKYAPKTRFLILEGFHKKWFGGRIGTDKFHGEDVVRGAGVGRKNKDHLLIELCNDLGIHLNEFKSTFHYADTIHPPCNVKQLIQYLKSEYKKQPSKKTFKQFAKPLLGEKLYKNFTTCAGYTDYENEDTYDTLYNYGFEDNYASWDALHIPWNEMMKRLLEKIGKKNVEFAKMVVSVKPILSNHFEITCKDNSQYYCEKLILATTIDSVLKLLPQFPIYREIHGQPFLRVYGKFSKSSIPTLEEYVFSSQNIVPGPLHKIIPINQEKGIYMIAYTDNEGAIILKPYLKNSVENREIFCSLLEKSFGMPAGSLKLLDMKDYYWPIGTHYYEPLKGNYKNRKEFIKEAQHPMPNLLVVGEMISENQGWTQGALESVKAVVSKKWVIER
jgi:hypothetical protein